MNLKNVLVFGGTNDSWAGSPVGELKYSDWGEQDLYSVLPAFCFFINKLRRILPNAHIIPVINTELKPEIEESFKAACAHHGIKPVALHNIDKRCGHPTIKGMEQIKNQIIDSLS